MTFTDMYQRTERQSNVRKATWGMTVPFLAFLLFSHHDIFLTTLENMETSAAILFFLTYVLVMALVLLAAQNAIALVWTVTVGMKEDAMITVQQVFPTLAASRLFWKIAASFGILFSVPVQFLTLSLHDGDVSGWVLYGHYVGNIVLTIVIWSILQFASLALTLYATSPMEMEGKGKEHISVPEEIAPSWERLQRLWHKLEPHLHLLDAEKQYEAEKWQSCANELLAGYLAFPEGDRDRIRHVTEEGMLAEMHLDALYEDILASRTDEQERIVHRIR